jgi:hypothetical protein
VVSRGGRPDLAGPALSRVQAPALLIVGGNDTPVIQLNRAALKQLRCEEQFVIVPGATHLSRSEGRLTKWRGSPVTGSNPISSRRGSRPPGSEDNRCNFGSELTHRKSVQRFSEIIAP